VIRGAVDFIAGRSLVANAAAPRIPNPSPIY